MRVTLPHTLHGFTAGADRDRGMGWHCDFPAHKVISGLVKELGWFLRVSVCVSESARARRARFPCISRARESAAQPISWFLTAFFAHASESTVRSWMIASIILVVLDCLLNSRQRVGGEELEDSLHNSRGS